MESVSRRDRRVWLGMALTALWLLGGLYYLGVALGWGNFFAQPLGDMGDFLDGAFAPLAFLWLVLGLFLQQGELAANNRAIQRQYDLMLRTAEHAEIQTRAIAANELHARQDTFIELAKLVTNQLEVIASMLFLSSQGSPGEGIVSDQEMDVLWARMGTGETSVFSRRLLLLWAANPDPATNRDLFYGTPIRTRHCETFIHAFERLLRNARGCDPDGMLADALEGTAHGRLCRVMRELRDGAAAESRPAGR